MAVTSFALGYNNIATTCGAGGYTKGTYPATLTVAPGLGAGLASALSGGVWARVTTVHSGSYAILKATAYNNSTGALTIAGYLTATNDTLDTLVTGNNTGDQSLVGGDPVEIRITSGTLNDLNTAVNNLQVNLNTNAINTATTAVLGANNVVSDLGSPANYAVTLPAVTAADAGKTLILRMSPSLTKLVSVTPPGAVKIDGVNAARVMWKNEVAILLTDGTDWFKIGGKTVPMNCIMYQSSGVTSLTFQTYVQVVANAAVTGTDNTGLMANTGSGYVNIVRSANYKFDILFTTDLTSSSGLVAAGLYVNATTGSPVTQGASFFCGSGVNASAAVGGIWPGTAGQFFAIAGYNGTNTVNTVGTATYLNFISVYEMPSW